MTATTLRLAVAGLLALAISAGATAALSASDSSPHAARPALAAPARTSFPGLAGASGEPTLPSLSSLTPAPGAVVQAPGPFDDRFVLDGLRFDGTAVTGQVRITSDVSELVDLQVLAGFYDRTGALLGTAAFEEHSDGDGEGHAGVPERAHPVRVVVPADLAGQAAGAAVGVTVLVNE